ncbi:hypothetical protein CY34DRAFT_327332 [Suillus luteus UH-Slu-Lm8-n1]|uniref:Uncharacterized protein n=1 Tax=Suillus luteus UH-Slu-Lm8-n1 TaxID=930992 RepID=A0A0D0ACZ3_9AGAM|nr:hypothetical protein CY34DRAFT_327332 [Suillus luteus UH-Slu-Lm8-n1]
MQCIISCSVRLNNAGTCVYQTLMPYNCVSVQSQRRMRDFERQGSKSVIPEHKYVVVAPTLFWLPTEVLGLRHDVMVSLDISLSVSLGHQALLHTIW